MSVITRYQTRHLRLDLEYEELVLTKHEKRLQQKMIGVIRNGLNNVERVIGSDYKTAVALVLFKYLVKHRSKINILGRNFCRVLAAKIDEFIFDKECAIEFITQMKEIKCNLYDVLDWDYNE